MIPLLGLALALAACKPEAPVYDPAHDYFTYANSKAYVTEHLALDLEVDFDTRELRGTATLRMLNLHPLERDIVLDSRDLTIETAQISRNGDDWLDASFAVGERHEVLGAPVTVTLPQGFDLESASELVDHKRRQCLSIHFFSDHKERSACCDHQLQERRQLLHV
jgi:aminopeptidase N